MPYQLKTPVSVMTAGVLLIIYGSLILSCGVCAGAGQFGDDAADADLAEAVPGYTIVQTSQTISNLLVGAVMILCGVGVMQLMPSARVGAYVTCVYELLMAAFHSVYNIALVFPAMQQNLPPAPFDVVQVVLWPLLVVGVALTVGFCGPIIYLLSVASARAAFADEFQGEPPPESRRRRPRDFEDDDDDDYRPRTPRSQSGDDGVTERPW